MTARRHSFPIPQPLTARRHCSAVLNPTMIYMDRNRAGHPNSRSTASFTSEDQLSILTLSSSRLNPLPARTFLWYLTVGHLTMGRMGPATGRGAMRRAFAWRAFLLQRGERPSERGTAAGDGTHSSPCSPAGQRLPHGARSEMSSWDGRAFALQSCRSHQTD